VFKFICTRSFYFVAVIISGFIDSKAKKNKKNAGRACASQGFRRIAFLNISRNLQYYAYLSSETEARGMRTDVHLVQGLDAFQPHWARHSAAIIAKIVQSEKVDALFITDDNFLNTQRRG